MALGAFPLGSLALGALGADPENVELADSAAASDNAFFDLSFFLASAATAADAVTIAEFWYLVSEAAASDAITSQLELHDTLVSDAYGRDYLVAAFPISMTDSAAAAVVSTAQVSAMVEMMETALASLSAAVVTEISQNLVSVAFAEDSMAFGYLVMLSDAAEADDTLTAAAIASDTLSDTAGADDAITAVRAVTVVLSENVLATDTLTAQQIMTALLESSAVVHALMIVGDEVYDVWVMNTELGAVSSYEDFDFSGFARLGERYYGLKDDGIYELTGSTDDGDVISAQIATGLNSLGSEYHKRVPAIYVGYTADNTLVAKVVTTDAGVKRENWYELSPIEKEATTDNRLNPAVGLKSVYWQFKLAGNNFTLDSVKLWRALTSRRK